MLISMKHKPHSRITGQGKRFKKEVLEVTFEGKNIDNILKMTIDEAVENKLIAPYKIKVIEFDLDVKDKYIKAGSKTKPFMQTEKARYDYLTRLINTKLFSGQPVPQNCRLPAPP